MDLAELSRMAASEDWLDRAVAGERLAPLAGDPAADVLLTALLDDSNTAVPQRTAHALLRQADGSSVRVFLLAQVSGVNEDAGAQCNAELQGPGLPERLRGVLAGLTHDEEEAVAQEAASALRLLITSE